MLKRRDQAICPYCGQRMLIRLGVQLSPLLADMFDVIERAGKHGIASDELVGIFYPGAPGPAARRRIKANVYLINARLESTDWEIRASPEYPEYILRKRKTK